MHHGTRFYIAHSRDEAIGEAMIKHPACSIEEDTHEKLFLKIDEHTAKARKGTSGSGYALLNRLCDYYQDSSYDPSDLSQLISEIEEFESDFTNDQQMTSVLKQFKKTCQQALSQNQHIYVFCD